MICRDANRIYRDWKQHHTAQNCVELPKRPVSWNSNRETWLNTNDIDNVLSRYPAIYPSFVYGGCLPRDFYKINDDKGRCIYGDVCTMNPVHLFKKGKRQIGFVFNLDAHGESGSHWVALMVDKTRRGIYYYDSTARKPHRDIMKFMQWIQSHVKFPIQVNRVAKQMENNECGIFAITFLVLLLEKPRMTFEEVAQYMGNDQDMNILRQILYT